VTKVIIGYCTE
jgi:hypothetical protein